MEHYCVREEEEKVLLHLKDSPRTFPKVELNIQVVFSQPVIILLSNYMWMVCWLTTPTTRHARIVLHHRFLSLSQTDRLLLTHAHRQAPSYPPSATPRSLLCFCIVSGLTGCLICYLQESYQRRIVTCLWAGFIQLLRLLTTSR